MSTFAPGATFGPFTIEGFVAGGGMGEVYAAVHTLYGHPVALKVLHERFAKDPRWHKRFSEEGILGLQLKHPHVLAARDLVEHDGQLALVMDLVGGGQTLLKVMDRDWPTGLSLGHALLIFLRIVSGAEYLHDKHVVHGDLKPENVLIDGGLRDPAGWVPKVTDFGTVSLIADPIVMEGRTAVVASPRYASPEHLMGVDQLVEASDVYALGLLLHYLLSGQHASGARTVQEAKENVQRPISLIYVVDQPEPLLGILARATAPDPADRYANCRELALAIRQVLDELGLDTKLEDLQAELATEVVEDRAKAQRELHQRVDENSDVTLDGPLPEQTSEITLGEPMANPDGNVSGAAPSFTGGADDADVNAEPVERPNDVPTVPLPRPSPLGLQPESVADQDTAPDVSTRDVRSRLALAETEPDQEQTLPRGGQPSDHQRPPTRSVLLILVGIGAVLGIASVIALWGAGLWP